MQKYTSSTPFFSFKKRAKNTERVSIHPPKPKIEPGNEEKTAWINMV